MRRSVAVVVVLFALAVLLIGGPSLLGTLTTSEVAPEQELDPEPEIVRPTGGESGFWPYLNSRRTFEKRSPINVVVLGDTEDVIRVLGESRETDWTETDNETAEADPGTHALDGGANESAVDEGIEVGETNITWTRTTGATRYAYVEADTADGGQWIEETAQLDDGTYYGHRYHIRLYESPNPDERWVAMQTHSEHFDWFTLRHRVDGSQAAQTRLETDLMNAPGIDVREDVSRVYLGNRNASDADGWATFVDLVGMAVVGGLVSAWTGVGERLLSGIDVRTTETDWRIVFPRDRVGGSHLLLAGTIVALVVGVRLGGIALERTDLLSVHAIAAVLYPFVGVGLPVGTVLFAGGLDRPLDAAIVAGGSLAVAIWVDYAFLGVHSLPIDVIGQRMLVVVLLGMIAAGATRGRSRSVRGNPLLAAGAVLWVALLGGTLLGFV